MRSTVFGLLLALTVLSATAAAAADGADTAQSRRAAAERYAKVSDFEKQFVAGLESGLQSLPPERKDEVMVLIKKHLHVDAIQAMVVEEMVKTFTTEELNALAVFYGSGPGKSAMDKMQPFMTSMMPQLQVEMARTLERIMTDLKALHSTPGA